MTYGQKHTEHRYEIVDNNIEKTHVQIRSQPQNQQVPLLNAPIRPGLKVTCGDVLVSGQ